MRRSIRASRIRVLALGASILISGSALAAAAIPAPAARAVTLPVNTVAVAAIAAQTTNPLSTTTVVAVTATETDQTGLLTFAVTGLPATATASITQPTLAGNATVDLTATFAAPFTGTVTVTATAAATLASSGGTGSKGFTWTADNTITVADPGSQATRVGTAVAKTITATDNDTGATLTYRATGLPAGLAISAATGAITGTPTARGTYTVTVTATDQTGATGKSAFAWDVTPNVIVVTAKAPAKAWVGVPVKVQASATDSAAGQAAGLTWSARNLPAGLTINKATGLISGRPTRSAPVTTTVTATDAYGVTGSATIAFKISAGVVIPNPGAQATTVGEWKLLNPIHATDAVPGDKPHYSATGLPAGMGFLGSPMLLYGWPSAPGIYHVTIHEQGSLGSISATTFKLTVKSVPGRSATGQIHLALDGKCLQDPSGKTANGTGVRVENCVSGATEQWTVASDGTIRVDSRCLSISGTGSYAGRRLQLSACGRVNPRQLWTQGNRGELISTASGFCATDPGSSRGNGPVPVLGACHVKSYEQWTLPAQPILTALGGSCADDHYSSGVNGNVIDMFWCNSTVGQDWTIKTDGTIRAGLYSNKCLTVRGTKAVIWSCGAAGHQKWTVVRTGTMSSELTEGGVCLAIPGLSSSKGTLLEPNGTQLITSTCRRTDPRDLWHIA
jgi:hypothetical protein